LDAGMWQIVLRHLGMRLQSAENELTPPQVLDAVGRFREDLVALGQSWECSAHSQARRSLPWIGLFAQRSCGTHLNKTERILQSR
jgi:hypothetical protein